ncbi:MAG: hypothetical protein ABGX16_13645 [Pirellulales bacterium]
MKLANHPTVKRLRQLEARFVEKNNRPLDVRWLRQLILDCGADDVGFFQVDRPEVKDQRDDILHTLPATKTLIRVIVRMNREPLRTPVRSVANLEFHHAGDEVNEIGRKLVRALEDRGVRALNPAMGFPMEME